MTTQDLRLTDVSATATSGCGCCSTSGTADPTPQTAASTADLVTTYGVAGMTCGHCVSSVTEGIGALDGVTDVDVTLVTGGTSRVTVTSSGPLDDAAVRAAVDEAGYDLTGRQG